MSGFFSDEPGRLRFKIIGIYAILFVFNTVAWLWAFAVLHGHPVLLGTAFLAYSFGLRHAVDADHIAAIDNVTRKLMHEGKEPIGVGFMFSLGHSTIVVVGSLLIASTAAFIQKSAALRNMASVVGTLVSIFFLSSLAAVNLMVLRSVYGVFQRVRNGQPYFEEDLNLVLSGRGLLARLLRPILKVVNQSWHMYLIGLLFGLGFDTATEIGVLGISASEVAKGLPVSSILVFPVLFAAGMSLVDTTDNILMLGAYGWAFVNPIRKLYYNLTITFVSVIVALGIGGIEALGLVDARFHFDGLLWSSIRKLNASYGLLGYLIVGFFALSWIASFLFYRWRKLDDLNSQIKPASV